MHKVIASALLVFGLGVGPASTAFAADTGNVIITRIAPWTAGTQVQIPFTVTCGSTTTNQLTIPNGGPDTASGRNFSIVLAALLAGKAVNINWVCSGSTPTVSSVRVS